MIIGLKYFTSFCLSLEMLPEVGGPLPCLWSTHHMTHCLELPCGVVLSVDTLDLVFAYYVGLDNIAVKCILFNSNKCQQLREAEVGFPTTKANAVSSFVELCLDISSYLKRTCNMM